MILNLIAKAKDLFFNNSASGLNSNNVQEAIDEVADKAKKSLPLAGGTLTGLLTAKKGIINYAHASGVDKQGYIKIATIVIPASYMDSPIEFDIITRNAPISTKVSILFTGVSGNDPALKAFTKAGVHNAYICKSATSTWDIYVQTKTVYEMVAISNLTYGYQFVNRTDTFIKYPNTFHETLPSGYTEATLSNVSMISERALQDGNGNNIVNTYALKTALTTAGIDVNILQSNNIGSSLPFNDLIKKRVVTFFTNWNDATNFPTKYGSGVLIPTLDGTDKIIYYQVKNSAWFGYVKLTSDQLEVSSLTWNKIDKDCRITLWNNTSTTGLSEQTISVDLTNIKAIEIQYIKKYYSDPGTYGLVKATTGKVELDTTANEIIQLTRLYPRSGFLGGLRDIRILRTDNQITICNGREYDESFNVEDSATVCVPTKIIGYYE